MDVEVPDYMHQQYQYCITKIKDTVGGSGMPVQKYISDYLDAQIILSLAYQYRL